MAKSTGNVVLLRDVEDRGHDPLALRLAFLGTRYRTQADLSWDAISAADRQLARWRDATARWAEEPSRPVPVDYADQLRAAFEDDLDTPRALQVLRRLERDPAVAPGARFETFARADYVLGLDLVRDVGRSRPPAAARDLPEGAAALLEARSSARTARDWAESDRLRAALATLGVTVTDTPDGQTWT
jgi:cysteinyl-tRNA synthetase